MMFKQLLVYLSQKTNGELLFQVWSIDTLQCMQTKAHAMMSQQGALVEAATTQHTWLKSANPSLPSPVESALVTAVCAMRCSRTTTTQARCTMSIEVTPSATSPTGAGQALLTLRRASSMLEPIRACNTSNKSASEMKPSPSTS